MVNQLLVTLVNSVLGSGKATARNNYAYHCPFCNHHKPKLEVNLTENREGKNPWHCWACDVRGTTIYNLFKQLKVEAGKLSELSSLVKTSKSIKETQVTTTISLPDEYINLSSGDLSDISAKHAIAYLKKRHISKYDILKYNIGYCKSGLYNNMIIIPTYDEDGRLNYFTARSCEGLFDAIAIKRNAIPLLGKNIQNNLMKKVISSKVDKIYIALDRDAIKQALRFCEMLLAENKEVYLVDLQDKDPSEMGFKNFTKLIQKTVPLTYYDLMEQKLAI
jgi:hypothetical protein